MHRGKIATAAAFLFFAALAVVSTYPLVTNLSGVVPGDGPGDNMQFVWNFWWVRTALEQKADVFYTPMLFAPAGAPLTLHTLTLLPAAVGATVLSSLSVVSALNITVLASLTLNGYCACLLAFRLCGDRGAAIAGGIIFGWSSFVTAHLQGHFNLTTAWTLPLFALAAIEAVRGRRAWAAAAGLVLGITTFIDYYYLIFQCALAVVILATTTHRWSIAFRGSAAGVVVIARRVVAALALIDLAVIAAIASTGGFTLDLGGRAISMHGLFNPLQAFWLLAMVWAWLRYRPRVIRERIAQVTGLWRGVAIAAVVFVAVSMPVILGAIDLVRSGGYVTQTYFWRSAPSGIDLATLVMGPPFHGIAGEQVRQAYGAFGIDAVEATAWLGIVPLVLAAMALKRGGEPGVANQWSVIGVVFFVWSLGPHLYVLGSNTGMILPGALLRYFPIVNNARIPSRAMVVVTLALAILSAAGFARWRSSGRRSPYALAVVCALLVAESLAAPYAVTPLRAPVFYEMLRQRPEPGAVLELPLGMRDGFGGRGKMSDVALFHQTIHGRPIAGGFLARLPPSVPEAYAGDPLLDGLLMLSEAGGTVTRQPMPAAGDAAIRLQANGIAFVVLDRVTAPQRLIDYVEKVLPLTLVTTEGQRSLYQVRKP